jgi:hypothetical protein
LPSGRFVVPIAEPILTAQGLPDTGATMTITIAGGDTLASLYADAALSTPITNPQVSDSAGRFYTQSNEWWGDSTQAYDIAISLTDGENLTYSDIYLLGEATNTSGFAPIFSPIFQGNPQAPTPSLSDNSNSIATTAFVMGQGYSPLNSPNFTGVPTAPTAAPGTNTTQIATTAFVTNALQKTPPTSPSSGYLVIAGIYFQWAPYSLGAAGGASQAVSWPIAFPTAIVGEPWLSYTGGGDYAIGTSGANQTGVTLTKSLNDVFARTGTVWAIGN